MIYLRSFFFSLVFIFAAINTTTQNLTTCLPTHSSDAPFIDNNGNPSALLLKLLDETNIVSKDNIQSITHEIQKPQESGGWLRKSGSERWEMEKTTLSQDLSKTIRTLGFIDEIAVCDKEYDYAVIFGSTAKGIRTRLAFLKYLYEYKNVRFKEIIFLVGERPRNTTIESDEFFCDPENKTLPYKESWKLNCSFPRTETEIAKIIYEQSDLPENWNTIKVKFIDTPMQSVNGTTVRPGTKESILEWQASNPTIGNILAISSQPHIHRQTLLLQKNMPTFTIQGVGPAMKQKSICKEILLDSIARSLYELYC